ILLPVRGVSLGELADSFRDARDGGRRTHGAIDIEAPWGTPVVASTDGTVHRLFASERGGLSVYHLDADSRRCYYYGHLSRYAGGLREGDPIVRGDVLGYVGATGNATEDNPHLHFAVYDVGSDRSCFTGTPVNPYSLLGTSAVADGRRD
ncbi:MAG: M23 family metallopeptidase, partial [Vicinamibacteria bacterium]